ncbi:ABC transporter substrate-binding protein [Gracilaria domingensis]|nr:ABC transporter substrate-binding protein [Gracilaria domingensis]
MMKLLGAKLITVSLLLVAFSSCHIWAVFARSQNCAEPISCDESTNYFKKEERIAIEYAVETIRDVAFSNTYVDFTGRGLMEDEFYKYRIVICGCPRPEKSDDRIVLYTNPKSLYINESPSLALLHFLQPTVESLSYVNSAAYTYTPAIREKVARKEAKEITDSNFVTDYSILSKDDSLSGSLIGTFTTSDYLKDAKNVPFIVIAESSETSPLARAEWMKIVGLYLGLSEKANDRFQNVVQEYESAKKKASEAGRRPSVLLNYPMATGSIDLSSNPDDNYKWFLPYRDQYTTDLVQDANAD